MTIESGITFQTDVGKIKRLAVKHIRDAFVSQAKIDSEWQSLNYTDRPDFDAAVAEYEQFIELLTKLGVELEFLPEVDNTTLDSLYSRDNALATNQGMILCNMGKHARRTEPEHQKALYESLGIPILAQMQNPACIEGGDVTWLKDNILAVGHGYRTNSEGIAELKRLTKGLASEVIEVALPHFRGPSDVLHLMSMISPIADDIAAVYSPLMSVPFRNQLLDLGYRLIEVPEDEYDSLGCNILAVEAGVCIMAEGNPKTHKGLLDAGVEVHTFKGKEISAKGCGGPTCLTRPLERELV